MNRYVSAIHRRLIRDRRIQMLAAHLSEMIPRDSNVVDVGCGDGLLAAEIGKRRPDLTIRGVELVVRADSAIDVQPFDGRSLPFDDRTCDVALLVDVLHHTIRPSDLLREASRAATRVVVKDHLLQGVAAQTTLEFMDRVGNASAEIPMPCNYLTPEQWTAMFADVGLRVVSERRQLGLYPFPLSLAFERSLHFIAALEGGES